MRMGLYHGKIWVNGVGPMHTFLSADSAADALRAVECHAAWLVSAPAPGVRSETRVTVEAEA